MTYKPENLTLDGQAIAGPRRWTYQDTGSTVATATASGFVTDAKDKGMKVGDQVEYLNKTAGINYGLRVSAVQDTGGTTGTLDGQVIIGDTS